MTRTPPLYALTKGTLGALARTVWRPTVTGLEHLPRDTGAILCPNHLAIADQIFLGVSTPRHITFWAKAEYFNTPGLRGGLNRRVVSGMGAIPVERAGGRAVLDAFASAVPVLRSGGLVTVFPEGTRSPDGRLYRGRTGAVRLAAQAGVPIIPVGITGTDRIRPPGSRLPRPVPITITFGPALPEAGHATGPRDFRAHTDEVIRRIQALTGQEYVPAYAR
ncbi:1-acyl-sn-glycerol-3-phosphate acyltransferase [Actinoplanes hulinensis]|uniref:1-acyl-sn-glycerol-3-phosphate acyltransferase n=1 Tax=Actinoplanes hulinensis TaxID=1144547 RepID=A0ABS7BEZ0_9ACTN|nr:lysophospholipid acyltransferase family protein [Actinoplanes hulinensis]MBW6439456.1 1-acyl-sn-glycerol-3-phosphate acyltransferase [Actinoplanes hulinensis]